jgi:hypothetical protein
MVKKNERKKMINVSLYDVNVKGNDRPVFIMSTKVYGIPHKGDVIVEELPSWLKYSNKDEKHEFYVKGVMHDKEDSVPVKILVMLLSDYLKENDKENFYD